MSVDGHLHMHFIPFFRETITVFVAPPSLLSLLCRPSFTVVAAELAQQFDKVPGVCSGFVAARRSIAVALCLLGQSGPFPFLFIFLIKRPCKVTLLRKLSVCSIPCAFLSYPADHKGSPTSERASSTPTAPCRTQVPTAPHHMVTRAKVGQFYPNKKYVMVAISSTNLSPLPTTVCKALADSNWWAAMQTKYDTLLTTRRGCWCLVHCVLMS
jgi:hypothetical protein